MDRNEAGIAGPPGLPNLICKFLAGNLAEGFDLGTPGRVGINVNSGGGGTLVCGTPSKPDGQFPAPGLLGNCFELSDIAPGSGLYGHTKFVQQKCIDVCGALNAFVERGVDVAGIGTGTQ